MMLILLRFQIILEIILKSTKRSLISGYITKKIITRFGLIKKERNVGYVLEVMLLFIG